MWMNKLGLGLLGEKLGLTSGDTGGNIGQTGTGRPGGQTMGERQRMAQRPPSFTDMLPYVAYSPEDKVFVLKDGTTLGALFELGPVPTEAQAAAYLTERASKVQEALQAIPESEGSPWIVQFYLSDDRDISGLNGYLKD